MKLLQESEINRMNTWRDTDSAESNKEPEYWLEGVFLQANIENRNHRVYPMEVMEPEVERYKREYVEQKRALGELMHPTNGSPNINLDRVSHLIVDIWREGDYFKARAKILDTPFGKIVKAMIDEGVKLGVSSRALGATVKKNGIDYVVDKSFRLITAGDIVFEPSAQSAFPNALVESVDWEYDSEQKLYVPVENKNLSSAELKELAQLQVREFRKILGV